MIITYITIALALFFAMNIGASGTAATMASAYGSGAIRSRLIAVTLAGVAAMLGAVTGGQAVTKTLGKGIVNEQWLVAEVAAIVITAACLTLFLANRMGIPLSTSEVTVGALIGVGVAYQQLYLGKVLFIISTWILLPALAFVLSFGIAKMIQWLGVHTACRIPQRWLTILLILAGSWEAYAAGMNNVANAIAPLVGAGMMDMDVGIILGGIFMMLGAMMLGGRVLETNGKKITPMTTIQGTIVSGVSGGLVIAASIFGIPVPLTQATTVSILGIGYQQQGHSVWKSPVVKKILQIWIVSPFASMLVSFTLMQVFLFKNGYTVAILLSALITTAGFISLTQLYKKTSFFNS